MPTFKNGEISYENLLFRSCFSVISSNRESLTLNKRKLQPTYRVIFLKPIRELRLPDSHGAWNLSGEKPLQRVRTGSLSHEEGAAPTPVRQKDSAPFRKPLKVQCGLVTLKAPWEPRSRVQPLLRWSSGWESVLHCRGHWFDPWSGGILHAAELASLCTLEPVLCNKKSHCNEKFTRHN